MSEYGDKPPTEVVRTKRLEIVDDEGTIRATLGTSEEGVTSLGVFDQIGRMRASLDAGDISEQGSGLSVFDTNGKPRAVVSMSNDPEQECFLILLDAGGEQRATMSLRTGDQAGVWFTGAQKNRKIGMAATNEGRLYLMLTDEGTPRAALRLAEGAGKELYSDLALVDKDARSGVAVGSGRGSDPHVRLLDRRQKVRGSFELGVGGEPTLYYADEEGKPIDQRGAFERVMADRGPWYQALFFAATLIAGGIGGAWVAKNTASVSAWSFPAALITVVVLVALSVLLYVAHRRGW